MYEADATCAKPQTAHKENRRNTMSREVMVSPLALVHQKHGAYFTIQEDTPLLLGLDVHQRGRANPNRCCRLFDIVCRGSSGLFSTGGSLTDSKASSKNMRLPSSEIARSLGRLSSCADSSSSSFFSSSSETTSGGECAGVDDGENAFRLEPERGGVDCLDRMGRLACKKFGCRT